MKRKNLIAICGLALFSLTSTACSATHNSSTSSKQSSKTVKVSKSKPKSKNNKKVKKKSQIKKTDNENDKKQQDNAKSKPQKTVTNQSSQQSTKQQASTNQQQAPNQAQNQVNANQHNQQPQQKTQGQINVERGYDPNGAPLLPGQDHAAGSNPDGSPDAWVQGQINWAKRNGLMNPDGTPTQKEKDLEASQDQYSEGDDGGQFGGYVPNP